MSVQEVTQAVLEAAIQSESMVESALPATMQDISNASHDARHARTRRTSSIGKLVRAIETKNVSSVRKQLKKDRALANGTITSDLFAASPKEQPHLLGFTPLLVAVSIHSHSETGHRDRGQSGPDTVKLLLAASADVNASNDEGMTPLDLAVDLNDEVLVPILLAAKADPNSRVSLEDAEWRTTAQTTPLLRAIGNESMSVVNLLLSSRADVNQPDSDGQTPLLKSYCHSNIELMRLLLDSNADVHTPGFKCSPVFNTIITQTSSNFDQAFTLSALSLLLENNADVDALDMVTPLHFCIRRESYEKNKKWNNLLVEFLIANSADINAASPMVTLSDPDPRKHGYDHYPPGTEVIIHDGDGEWDLPPLYYACSKGRYTLVKILVSAKADVNQSDIAGRSALGTALFSGYNRIARFLFRNGAETCIDELERIQFESGGYHTSLEQVEAALQDGIDLLDPKTPITAVKLHLEFIARN